MLMGVPGWPDSACCTASMQSVRMVLMASFSIGSFSLATVKPVVTAMLAPSWLFFLPSLRFGERGCLLTPLPRPLSPKRREGRGKLLRRDLPHAQPEHDPGDAVE